MTTHSARSEQERLAQVYQQWHGARTFAAMFHRTVGLDLASLRVLDVGCGSGNFLRQLIDWGARPANLGGTELLADRLDAARAATAGEVQWHLGELETVPGGGFDLITAHTVFSSILDDAARGALAAAMRDKLRPGGWCLVFDFRYNNPRNPNVRKVTRAELARLFPDRQACYRSLLLAPPLARLMSRLPHMVPETLAALVPPLRSHFVYMACKGA